MKITKLGHCCLVLEEKGVKILTDPGSFTTAQNEVTGINAVLITHEHADHYHLDSLKTVLKNNPQATVITNSAVGALLDKEGITHQIIGDGQSTDVQGIKIEGFGKEHGKIYQNLPTVENTGYFVADRFYFPGDSLHSPSKPVDVLALPVAGPWLKMSEVIEYAKEIQPRVAFPVHDGFKPYTVWHKWPADVLPTIGIEFVVMQDGDTHEF